MRFLSDENFRLDVVKYLEAKGHDVKRVPKGYSDHQVSILAKKEKRIILTNDTDFSISLQFPPAEHFGILIFKIHPPRYEFFLESLESFIHQGRSVAIKGKTFLIERNAYIEIE